MSGDCCGGTQYDSSTHCCENDTVVAKVTIYVINRSGGQRTGWRHGHIDMAIPGAGMVGFFGYGNGGSGNRSGMGMTGNMNNSYNDWTAGPTRRPNSTQGPAGGLLSTFLPVSVCPAQAEAMRAEIEDIDQDPGNFNLLGGNCSTTACQVLDAGGLGLNGINGLDNPQNLMDELQGMTGGNFFNGYTSMDPSGNVGITVTGPGPAPQPPSTPRHLRNPRVLGR